MGLGQSTGKNSRKRRDEVEEASDDESNGARAVRCEGPSLLDSSGEESSEDEDTGEAEEHGLLCSMCHCGWGGSRASRMMIPNNSAGTEPKDKYNIEGGPIGAGGYGTVRKCVPHNGRHTLAMKTMAKANIPSSLSFQQEIDIQLLLDHPNIVKLFEVFEDRQNVYLIMELCEGGEIFDLIVEHERFDEGEAALLMRQMTQAIYYMHVKSVAHRDLKPENFLLARKGVPLAQNTLKLIDFGLSKEFVPGQSLRTKIGTPTYAAPEIMLGGYNEKVDMWSLGVLMYVLLCGYAPFDGRTVQETIRAARKNKLRFQGDEWSHVSDQAKSFVSRMCDKDPKTRIDAETAAHDPWLQTSQETSLVVSKEQSKNLLRNLRNFGGVHRFKRAALHIVAHRIDSEALSNLQAIWRSLDVNGDGTLTLRELKEGLEKSGVSSDLDGHEFEKHFKMVDTDASGSIDYTEFIAAMLNEVNFLQEEACWEAFRVFDRDGSGTISTREFAEVLNHQGVKSKTKGASLQKIFEEVDANHDGEIDFDEFMAMLRDNDDSRAQ